ncbi:CobW family GTP-binding protein [Alteromonas gracilis]|uniref:CobW family GTP-binding protein n=1 Tax=Alteromonas gracilis TaxID=1479524 RepID=UPI0037369BB3
MIKAVPTNIITGFLGVGKTSALLHLLKQKPNNERWAVLINEFGEIGIDGALVEGSSVQSATNQPDIGGNANTQNKHKQVFIKEVPGGCMCCAAGLPMQIALNQLLAQSKPDRLLIEPTGLGHPVEVLQTLAAEHYQDVLNIQKTITLVDARKLKDPRYTNHDTFNQQIDIADIVIGNKRDLYDEFDAELLSKYVAQRGKQSTPVMACVKGELPLALLEGKSSALIELQSHSHHHHSVNDVPSINEQPFPDSGFLRVENAGEGFKSLGWRYSPAIEFNRSALLHWIKSLDVERLKAVVITSDGIFSYNLVDNTVTENELNECSESKIEIIATELSPSWDEELANCVVSR